VLQDIGPSYEKCSAYYVTHDTIHSGYSIFRTLCTPKVGKESSRRETKKNRNVLEPFTQRVGKKILKRMTE